MDIIVCIKRTPDTEARIRVGEDGASVDESGVKTIVSPYDEFAVEAALRAREERGDGEVAVLTLGGSGSAEALRSALAMGADRGVLIRGEVTMDGLATAKALAAELGASQVPLILFGIKAADDDQQQVGPMVATLLGRPCVTAVADFRLEGDKVSCEREVEGGVEVVEADLPAVLTITKGAFEPRYASLKGIMAAKRKPLEEKDGLPQEGRLRLERLTEPPPRPEGRIVGEGPDAVKELVRLLREEAGAL